MTAIRAARCSRPSALVVEDDDLTAHLIQLLLRDEGYAVSRAPTGRAAQAYITRSAPLQLVTLDGRLPDVSGPDVLEFIRARPGWEDVPVLMVTGSSIDEQDLVRALAWNDVTYLSKPFAPSDLSQVIGRISTRNALPLRREPRVAAISASQGDYACHR